MNLYDSGFAAHYDLVLYGEDEHSATAEEMQFMEWALKAYAGIRINNVLDAGCGTGRFLVPLAKKGFSMTGIDSSRFMLEQAGLKLKRKKLKADLVEIGIEELECESSFDAVICIDSVLCYFKEKDSMLDALKRLHRSLVENGIIVIETWNIFAHSAMLNKKGSFTNKGKKAVARILESNSVDPQTKVLTINLDVNIKNGGKEGISAHSESLYIPEFSGMKSLMKSAGFKNIRCFSGYDFIPASAAHGDSMIYVGTKSK
jgi:2-polyprenyl-3-methyl-5-hydroxy-6-metoxy-1,4-benzoquinol methylase